MTFSSQFPLVNHYIGNPELDYMSWAMNWGLAYGKSLYVQQLNQYFTWLYYLVIPDLPNHTWIIEHRHEKFPKPLVQRRHRRDLYNRLEIAMDKYVYLL